jgi:hypothetical protein
MNIKDEKWHMGTIPSVIITLANHAGQEEVKEEEKKYYGGLLVAESVPNIHFASLISAAPDLYRVCKSLLQALGPIRDGLDAGELSPLELADKIRRINFHSIQGAVNKAEGWFR